MKSIIHYLPFILFLGFFITRCYLPENKKSPKKKLLETALIDKVDHDTTDEAKCLIRLLIKNQSLDTIEILKRDWQLGLGAEVNYVIRNSKYKDRAGIMEHGPCKLEGCTYVKLYPGSNEAFYVFGIDCNKTPIDSLSFDYNIRIGKKDSMASVFLTRGNNLIHGITHY